MWYALEAPTLKCFTTNVCDMAAHASPNRVKGRADSMRIMEILAYGVDLTGASWLRFRILMSIRANRRHMRAVAVILTPEERRK